MALNFPNSPTNGQAYFDTSSGNRYVYDSANTLWKYASNNSLVSSSNNQVIYNNNGVFAGNSGLVFAANTLYANTVNVTGYIYGNGAFLTGVSTSGGGSGVVDNTLTFTNSSIFSNTLITSSNTSQILDVFSTSTWRSANYIITMNTTPSLYHTTQIVLLHDGTTAYITEYGTIFTSNNLATFDATIVSGNVRLNVIPSVAVTTINLIRTTNK